MLTFTTNLTPPITVGGPTGPAGPLGDVVNRLVQPTIQGDVGGLTLDYAPFGYANPALGIVFFAGLVFVLANGVIRLVEKASGRRA